MTRLSVATLLLILSLPVPVMAQTFPTGQLYPGEASLYVADTKPQGFIDYRIELSGEMAKTLYIKLSQNRSLEKKRTVLHSRVFIFVSGAHYQCEKEINAGKITHSCEIRVADPSTGTVGRD